MQEDERDNVGGRKLEAVRGGVTTHKQWIVHDKNTGDDVLRRSLTDILADKRKHDALDLQPESATYWAAGTEERPAYDDELLRAWPGRWHAGDEELGCRRAEELIGMIKQARPFSSLLPLFSLSPDFSRSSRALFFVFSTSLALLSSLLCVCLSSLYISSVSLSIISLFSVPAHGGGGESEKDAKLAQKLAQLHPFIALLPHECMGQLASFRPI